MPSVDDRSTPFRAVTSGDRRVLLLAEITVVLHELGLACKGDPSATDLSALMKAAEASAVFRLHERTGLASAEKLSAFLVLLQAAGLRVVPLTGNVNVTERARRLLEEAYTVDPKVRFERMVESVLIDSEGRVTNPRGATPSPGLTRGEGGLTQSEFESAVYRTRTLLEAVESQAIMAERNVDQPCTPPHLSWMLARAIGFFSNGRIDKANRWLGFVQGVLADRGWASLDELMQANLPSASDGELQP